MRAKCCHNVQFMADVHIIIKTCVLFYSVPQPTPTAKLYTIKELVVMTTSISNFHALFCIPSIKYIAFHLPYGCILENHNCSNTRHEEFNNLASFQYLLCNRNYTEQVVASFSHQIQSKYYDINITVSNKAISLEHFSANTHTLPFYSP